MATLIFQNTPGLTEESMHMTVALPLLFHQRLPGYERTPLLDAPQLARRLGVGKLWIKDETRRFDMPSFKILGTSWAVYRALMSRMGTEAAYWETFEDLARLFAPLRPLTLIAATDGNHGRAVAHIAALLGFDAHIFVPRDMTESRMTAIKREGARVTIVNGTYDEAVRQSAREQDEHHL